MLHCKVLMVWRSPILLGAKQQRAGTFWAIVSGCPVYDILDWLFSRALGKWGTTMDADVRLWLRLTPRILREMTGRTLHMDESLLARKFNEASWEHWPPQEKAAPRTAAGAVVGPDEYLEADRVGRG